ncbi:MAG TPA: DoxX family protein [Candidatus Methylomirabilis sp.]|nr:DoxX family protein [Candidatus Methylomirabilis sp.]
MQGRRDRFKWEYDLLINIGNSLQSPFLLFVRLYWGWQFVEDGWGKLHNLPKVIEYFGSLGLPAPGPTAYFVSILELIGGVLLALGLGSRLIAFLLTANMTVAYITGDREALLSIFSDPDKFIAAAPFSYLMASLIVLIFGPGRYALDYLVERFWNRSTS